MSPEREAYRQQLLEMLEMLEREHRERCAPVLRRLVALEALEPPKPVILTNEQWAAVLEKTKCL